MENLFLHVSDSTRKLYLHNLKKLGGDFTSLDFLTKTSDILKRISEMKPTTGRSYLIAIVSALKGRDQKLYDFYYEHMMKYNKALKDRTEKTPTQEANWESWSSIEELLQSRIASLPKKSRRKPLTEDEYDTMLNTILLCLYVLQPPRRSQDYLQMIVGEPTNTDHNFLHNGKFYFNKYKTAKTYETQTEPISDRLMDILKIYLKFRPSKDFLLVDYNGKPLERSNQITRRLNSIFGKKISSSMLRNIYASEKFSKVFKELEHTADAMGTSVEQLKNTYTKH